MFKRLPIILLLIFGAIVYIGTAFEPAIGDDADATHAEAAKEMLLRHDGVTLYVNGIRYLEKAPFLYWLVALSYKCFGINQFAVRFPSMVAVLLLAWLAYTFGCWAYSRLAGFYAAAVMISCIGMFLFTRIMIPEALLTVCLSVAHLCFLQAYFGTGTRQRFYYGFYAAAAFAVLTKGLIGLVFTAGPVFLFLLITGKLSTLPQIRLVSGSAVFLAIAVPWHLLAGFRNEGFFWFYFVNEHYLRFIGQRLPKDYNKLPFFSFWLLHLVWLFPWSFGLPLLFKLPRFPIPQNQQIQINLYLWLWAGMVLIFFNISTSQEYYTFPAYPPLAILLGSAFASAEGKNQRYLLWMNGILAAMGLLFALGIGLVIWNNKNVPPASDISAHLNQSPADAKKYTFSLGHILDLTPQTFASLSGPAIGAALALACGFALAFWFRWRQDHFRATIAMVSAMGLLFVCAHFAHVQFEPILSSRALAKEINQRWEPNAKIVFNGEYETGSSIGFYTNKQILLLNGQVTGMEFGSHYPDAPKIFLNYEDVRRLWVGSERVFLFTEDIKKEALLKNLNLPTIPVATSGGKSLLTNR